MQKLKNIGIYIVIPTIVIVLIAFAVRKPQNSVKAEDFGNNTKEIVSIETATVSDMMLIAPATSESKLVSLDCSATVDRTNRLLAFTFTNNEEFSVCTTYSYSYTFYNGDYTEKTESIPVTGRWLNPGETVITVPYSDETAFSCSAHICGCNYTSDTNTIEYHNIGNGFCENNGAL